MKAENITYAQIKALYKSKGYKFFDEKPFDLNLFGIRAESRESDRFDDLIGVAYLERAEVKGGVALAPRLELYPATTDPGRDWLENPMNAAGAFILKEGYYPKAFRLSPPRFFHGTTCLLQNAPMKGYRDNDRDTELDTTGVWAEGFYGIFMHEHLQNVTVAERVGKSSAGCQVPQKRMDMAHICRLVEKQAAEGLGSVVSYALFREEDL